tara:strand:+ start:10353 stop:11462 length:1110 start_codon:yes stop_codon:yes gene_type:complete
MFLYTCENNNENIEGCIDLNACNFNEEANVDDGSCQFAEENFDCEGNCLNDVDADGICDENENTSWVFVANEGNYGASNGTVSMIDDQGNMYETEALGDVVQAVEVHENKLIVLVNNSHMMKIFDITDEGLSMPGIEVSTENSSPREMVVVNNKVYFTNWNSQDVKIFNLFNYTFETSISIDGLPEDIEYDGEYLWVTVPHSDFYFSTGNMVYKIDIATNAIVESIEVGSGPQQIAFDNGEVFISRTFYDDSFNTFHGATKIGDETTILNYGAGTACGGSILKHQNSVFRSFEGGISPINEDLTLDSDNKIGDYDQSLVYHVEEINGNIWFGLTNYSDYNQIKVIDSNGQEVESYNAGLLPGDFTFWQK